MASRRAVADAVRACDAMFARQGGQNSYPSDALLVSYPLAMLSPAHTLQSRPSCAHIEQRAQSCGLPLPMLMRPSSFSVFVGSLSLLHARHACANGVCPYTVYTTPGTTVPGRNMRHMGLSLCIPDAIGRTTASLCGGLLFVEFSFVTQYILMANGMTTPPKQDVYHRDNCIAPEILVSWVLF